MNIYVRIIVVVLGVAMVVFCMTRLISYNVSTIRELPKPLHSKKRMRNLTAAVHYSEPCDPSKQRLIIFVRHADRLFRKNSWERWLDKNFDQKGKYVPKRAEYPDSLPDRKGGIQMFHRDPPLHGDGYNASFELGRILRMLNISIEHAYSSLPLRCLETAEGILRGAGNDDLVINMESGFHERAMNKNDSWYMTPKELRNNGHNVNKSYKSLWPGFDLEPIPQVHKRIYTVTKKVMKRHEKEGGNILVVGHANTGEMTMSLMTGLPVPSNFIYYRKVRDACKIRNLAATIFREGCNKDDPFHWYRYEPEEISKRHDWKCMGTVLTPENSIYVLPNGTWVMQNEEKPEEVGTIKAYEVFEGY